MKPDELRARLLDGPPKGEDGAKYNQWLRELPSEAVNGWNFRPGKSEVEKIKRMRRLRIVLLALCFLYLLLSRGDDVGAVAFLVIAYVYENGYYELRAAKATSDDALAIERYRSLVNELLEKLYPKD